MNEKMHIRLFVEDPLQYAASLVEKPGYEGSCALKTFFMFQPDDILVDISRRTEQYIIREIALFNIKDDRIRTDLALEMEDENLRAAGLVNCKDPEQIRRYLKDESPMVCRRAKEMLKVHS